MARRISPLPPVEGEVFLLTSPFIERAKKLAVIVGKIWERCPVAEMSAKSHRINGPLVLLRAHKPKFVSSNLTSKTIFKHFLNPRNQSQIAFLRRALRNRNEFACSSRLGSQEWAAHDHKGETGSRDWQTHSLRGFRPHPERTRWPRASGLDSATRPPRFQSKWWRWTGE